MNNESAFDIMMNKIIGTAIVVGIVGVAAYVYFKKKIKDETTFF